MTPTARLLRTEWYRPGGRYDAAPIVHPPLQPAGAAGGRRAARPRRVPEPHLHAAGDFRRRRRRACARSIRPRCRRSPTKVQTARAAAERDHAGGARDRHRLGQEALQAVAPTWWCCARRRRCRRTAGCGSRPTAGCRRPPAWRFRARLQNYTIQVEPTFFVNGVYCEAACDPDTAIPIEFRGPVKAAAFAAALQATDVTDPRPRARAGEIGAAPARELGAATSRASCRSRTRDSRAQPPATTLAADTAGRT